MSNIRKHAVVPTSSLHLRDANDEPMYAEKADGTPDLDRPMKVNLFGPGSKPYADAQAISQNKMIDRLKAKGKTKETADEKRRQTAEVLAACTESFENVDYVTDDDPPKKLTGRALALAVYNDQSIGFVAEQVGRHIGDWANFSKASTPS